MTIKQPVTLLDVARAAQVSRATASLVIRNSPVVAEKTRIKVEQAMQDLGYIYNRSAAKLRSARSGVIGLILPNISNPFFSEFLEGIEKGLFDSGHTVFLAISHEEPAQEAMALSRLLEQGCDGIVICPTANMTDARQQRLHDISVPVVQALRLASQALDYVGPDYAEGVRQSVAHLVALGHRRIAFVHDGLCHSATDERLAGLAQAQVQWQLTDFHHLKMPLGGAGENDPALAEALQAGITAAICLNDIIAMQVTSLLIPQGIQIGRDFSIVGFDGTTLSQWIHPKLTTVNTFPRLAGEAAARRLTMRMANSDLAPDQQRHATALEIGQTTGRQPKTRKT